MAKFKAELPALIVNCLEKGPMTRGQLKKKLGVPRTTLFDHLVKLIIADKVVKFKTSQTRRGRPYTWYKLV